jgi:hypothetical protein
MVDSNLNGNETLVSYFRYIKCNRAIFDLMLNVNFVAVFFADLFKTRFVI